MEYTLPGKHCPVGQNYGWPNRRKSKVCAMYIETYLTINSSRQEMLFFCYLIDDWYRQHFIRIKKKPETNSLYLRFKLIDFFSGVCFRNFSHSVNFRCSFTSRTYSQNIDDRSKTWSNDSKSIAGCFTHGYSSVINKNDEHK